LTICSQPPASPFPYTTLFRSLLVLYGSKTGRDGIGGASVLASQGFEEGTEAKRPSVQIGDPFTGKKLIECTLELLDHGLIVSLQDRKSTRLNSSHRTTSYAVF